MNMDNIKNKTALVTGGASGIGLCCAQKLLQNGAKAVAILDLSTSTGQTVLTTLEKEFGKGKALFFPCNVGNSEELAEVFKKVWNTLNGIDILINNAGMFDENKWEQTIKVNVGGVVQGTLLAMDLMGKHKGGKGGTVVNIASILALELYPVCPVYCASKTDVLTFSRCLQNRFEKTGVRVLVMCPGITATPLINELSSRLLDFVDTSEVPATLPAASQPPETVAQSIMTLIQKAKSGAVWVSEENRPPRALEFLPCKKVELNL